jgi:hypothetical protein
MLILILICIACLFFAVAPAVAGYATHEALKRSDPYEH